MNINELISIETKIRILTMNLKNEKI